MTRLREALRMAVTHCGWEHLDSGHVPRDLAQVVRATGNQGGQAEASPVLGRMGSVLEGEMPGGKPTLAFCPGMLAEEAAAG